MMEECEACFTGGELNPKKKKKKLVKTLCGNHNFSPNPVPCLALARRVTMRWIHRIPKSVWFLFQFNFLYSAFSGWRRIR